MSGMTIYRVIWVSVILALVGVIYLTLKDIPEEPLAQQNISPIAISHGIDTTTGLIVGAGFELVRTHCTGCHSAKLVTQNRLSRDGWVSAIRWMQQTQGLWDLGPQENKILDYLHTHYGPVPGGRRQNLDLENIVWYRIKD